MFTDYDKLSSSASTPAHHLQTTLRPEQLTAASTSMNRYRYLSQFRQDTGEPSMPAQEINPTIYLLCTDWPDQNLNPQSCH